MIITVTRALTITQPWATLVAIGAKRVETRSWETPYRGWLAIHSSKAFPKHCQALCTDDRNYNMALLYAGYKNLSELPLGKIIALAKLIDCDSTNSWTPAQGSREYEFGDYRPGRWAWKLIKPTILPEPITIKGQLGIWRLPTPIQHHVQDP